MPSRSRGSISRASFLKSSESRRLQRREKNGVLVLRVRIEVVANASGEESRILRNDGDLGSKSVQVDVVVVLVVDEDITGRRDETKEGESESRFP